MNEDLGKTKLLLKSSIEDAVCFRCRLSGELLYPAHGYRIVKCPECGQIFTSPRPNANARQGFYQEAFYFEKIYGNFSFHPSRVWQNIVSQRRMKLIMRFVPKGRLLDIGCGYGVFLNTARRYGWKVAGTDISKPAVEYAWLAYKLDVFCGEIENAPYLRDSFDVVTFWDVLEHVPDPAFFLNSVKRLLKLQGLIGFSVPNIDSFVARFFKGRWWTLRPEQHLWHFGNETLQRLLDEQGFKPLVRARPPINGPSFTRPDSMVVLAVRG